ncbi:hypothetical protein SAMN04489724_0234 [Algoriphagus locisalis]|uniref:Uncharacterized protein n=1 Tax=Algoriphagus locisalis TaxID=305507 RepID=A0A1I7E8F0_9BACT|nr:hypothetical protein [Algoriphagus locisalis]SFU20093.1 hypothetical protein SAMN04489724_0234 [Algoriphagus locisalis]
MVKNIAYLTGLLVVGYLSYHYPLFSFVLLAILGLILCYLLLALVIKLIQKRIQGKWFHVPLALLSIIVVGLITGFLAPLEEPLTTTGNVSEDLEYAHRMDQADRMNLKFFIPAFRSQMKGRDSVRLNQVLDYSRAGKIAKGRDKYYAAFVLHHNPEKDSLLYRKAHELAQAAASETDLTDDFQVQWLSKATYDRWMLSIGKEQEHDTQGGVSFELQ